jgi:hypothetical protein
MVIPVLNPFKSRDPCVFPSLDGPSFYKPPTTLVSWTFLMASNYSATDDSSQTVDDAFDDVTASTTSDLPVQITNAVSLAACIAVAISYFLFRRKNKRIMERTSLILAVSMASADLLLHVRITAADAL